MSARTSLSFADRYGPWALVTGASSGIGAEFARQLAARGLSVILCARRKERLDALGAEIAAAHGVSALPIEVDLGRPDFLPELLSAVGDRDIGLLVNNAGFGDKGPFLEGLGTERGSRGASARCEASSAVARAKQRPTLGARECGSPSADTRPP